MFKKYSDKLEGCLTRYRSLIGTLVLIMLVILTILTYFNFDKQNQIIETGGFTDGKIKCVCNEEAWEQFQNQEKNYTFSDVILQNG